MGGQERGDPRRQHQLDGRLRRIDPHEPPGPVAGVAHLVQGLGDLRQGRRQLVQQPRSGLGQRHAAGGAVQQSHPQPRLQVPQGLAERRGGDPALQGRAPEAALPGDRREGVEIVELQAGHCAKFRTVCVGLSTLSHDGIGVICS